MSISRRTLPFLAAIVFLQLPGVAAASPLGRAFTYQGQLSVAGVPVDSAVTMRFSLWNMAGTGDPPVGGVVIGGTQIIADIPVSGGIFTVQLNGSNEFGMVAFNGDARWLQVEICADQGCTTTTVLGPRQAITGAPYALGPWQLNGTALSYTAGYVGVGTTAPSGPIHVQTNGPSLILQDTAIAANQAGYIGFWNSVPAETGWIGYGSPGSPDFSMLNARSGGALKFWTGGFDRATITSTGRLGVGTSTPAERLDVRGNIKLGTSGEYFAPSAGENLRFIRGKVLSAGSVSYGTGFTVSKISTGVYSISFTTGFTATPVVTASAESNGTVARFAMVNGPTTLACWVRIVNGSGSAADCDFYFIAVGPR
jgi:hypothetical protein